MAKRKLSEPNITEPIVEEPVTSPTLTESPEVTTPVVESPEPEVVIPEPEPTPEPEKAEAVKVNKEHTQRCTMTLLPGGKYLVMLEGKRNLGKWGKEKAERICEQYNK